MIKQAIIPLAGLGTRMLPLTSVMAKELLPINGKPGLEYILDECIEAGIKEFIFIISSKKKLNPAGQWNSSRIIYTEKKVEHWLNGQLLLEFEPFSEDWYFKRNSGKWDDFPEYGKFKKGYIALQDHDSPIWFRSIKIKKL